VKEAPRDDQHQLLQQIANGSESAFEQFYNIHWNKIYSLALAYLKSSVQAQDVVQEVFLKIWTKRQNLGHIENPASFIYIMGRNEVIRALKKKINLDWLNEEQTNLLPDDLMLPHQIVDLKELEKKIGTAINNLPTQQKLIFKLSREEGLNHEQIAGRLGIEKATVKNHIVRALNSLRRNLQLGSNNLLFWYLLVECMNDKNIFFHIHCTLKPF
jgi:RNA polymerase sigma-70 factor (ECF subfamily)